MTLFIKVKDNGQIVENGDCPRQFLKDQSKDGLTAIEAEGDYKNNYYDWSNETVEEKIDNPAALSGTTLSNLPLPCTVTMRGPTSAEAYVEQDGLTLDADVPGQYRVTVVADHPKYYDAEFEVDL